MRDLLTKHRIPTASLALAVAFLNNADPEAVESFNAEFGLTPDEEDALATARFAVDAILRGAGAVDKVVGHVAKRMLGIAPKAAVAPSPVTVVGVPVVDTPEVVVVPVVVEAAIREEVAPVVKIPGRRGRKRLGNSDFCKAVVAIEAAPTGSDRQTILNCIIAAGIKAPASAPVYLWRYNKGERE